MAAAYVELVLRGMVDVDPSARLVAVVLANAGNIKHNGISFPSVAYLMRCTGLTERSVQRQLGALVLDGWLEVVGAGNGGRGQTTRYRLNLPRLRASAEKIDGDIAARKGAAHGGVSVTAIKSDNPATDAGVTGFPKGATHGGVFAALKGAIHDGNPATGGVETPPPVAPEPEVNRKLTREKGESASGEPSVQDRLKESFKSNRKGGLSNVSVLTPKQPQMTREEQLRAVAKKLDEGGGE